MMIIITVPRTGGYDKERQKSGLTANQYQALAARTIDPGMTKDDMRHHALHGMVGEIGELHSLFQKLYQGHAFDPAHEKKELGDLLWFAAEYCTSEGRWCLLVMAIAIMGLNLWVVMNNMDGGRPA